MCPAKRSSCGTTHVQQNLSTKLNMISLPLGGLCTFYSSIRAKLPGTKQCVRERDGTCNFVYFRQHYSISLSSRCTFTENLLECVYVCSTEKVLYNIHMMRFTQSCLKRLTTDTSDPIRQQTMDRAVIQK